jgi:hypothetical protein
MIREDHPYCPIFRVSIIKLNRKMQIGIRAEFNKHMEKIELDRSITP